MRVLFIAPRFHTNQYQVVKTLMESKHEVFFHVAFLGPTEDHRLLTPKNYKQSRISSLIEKAFGKGGVKRPYYFPEVMSYWKEFAKLKPDVVVIRDPYKYFSLIAAVCALFTKSKIVFYTQEELHRFRTKLTFLKQSLTISLFRAAWMTPIMGHPNGKTSKPKHMYYVPLPIPLVSLNHISNKSSDTVTRVLMVGKYHQDRKMHLLFIDAVSKLSSKYKFEVTIVGECVTEEQKRKYSVIEETIHKLGLTETIALKKNVPFHQMEELYTSHDIFVLPAINEQYGVSTTEALAYGLPVICTDTCGARFNIQDGENGFVVKSGSVEELTEALEVLLSDKEKTLKMSERSVAYVQNNLSGSAFYEKFSDVINTRFKFQGFNLNQA